VPRQEAFRFRTADGTFVPGITASQMREVDRIAVEEMGLGILQMMENAGRNLAETAQELSGATSGKIVVLAGGGGNGGGGLCCARHLLNHGVGVSVVLDRPAARLVGPARAQHRVLARAGHSVVPAADVPELLKQTSLVIDALIGYSLRGAPHGRVADLIALCNRLGKKVLSLDVPSGLDATTGHSPGAVVRSDVVLTLALPKTGLARSDGALLLADIGIPRQVFARIGVDYTSPFGGGYRIQLEPDWGRDEGGS
jgi:NAD(P)H-hydrate epimerase